MKTVIVLIGPKGAGKSTIGQLLATDLQVNFVRVEPLFLELRERLGASHPQFESHGFQAVLRCLREALLHSDTVCFETTGAATHIFWLLAELRRMARVLLVHVLVTREQSLERIHARDASIHIPVSDDQIECINTIAERVELPWAVEIDNRGGFEPNRIISTIVELLESEEHRGA